MDILILVDKSDEEKFKDKAQNIKLGFENVNRKVKVVEKLNNEFKGVCLVFSNDPIYMEYLFKNSKADLICVTDRLESEYILSILNYVKDIFFLRVETEEIIARIENYIKHKEDRKRCMKTNVGKI